VHTEFWWKNQLDDLKDRQGDEMRVVKGSKGQWLWGWEVDWNVSG